MASKTEIKYHSGRVVETKRGERDGEPVGFISGLIATFDIDRGDFFGRRDQFLKGAFLKSIAEHKARNNRQIRFKDGHDRTIGGFPIQGVHETDQGLFGTAEVNLNIQQGREVFALAKQGVLVDFSIGFIPVVKVIDEDQNLRTITEAIIIEGSIVDEPMNPKAVITDVKSLDLDKIQHALENDNTLSKKEASEIVELLNTINENNSEDHSDKSKSVIDVAKVKLVTDQKGIEKLLKKCGFSQDAATTLVKFAKEFKTDNRGEPGDGNNDDQGDPENLEVLNSLNELINFHQEKQVVHELKQIKG